MRQDCPLIGLCFECQLFDNLIVGPHDIFMDKVVTEAGDVRRPRSLERPTKCYLTPRDANARRY